MDHFKDDSALFKRGYTSWGGQLQNLAHFDEDEEDKLVSDQPKKLAAKEVNKASSNKNNA